MDINVAWNELVEFLENRQYLDAYWHLDNVMEWIGKGGFLPDNVSPDKLYATAALVRRLAAREREREDVFMESMGFYA